MKAFRFFWRQEGFDDTSKENEQFSKVTDASSSAKHILPHAGGTAMLHAGGNIMPIEKQATIWQPVPCSQLITKDIELSTKTAQFLTHHRDGHEEDGSYSCEKDKNLIISSMSKTKKHHSCYIRKTTLENRT